MYIEFLSMKKGNLNHLKNVLFDIVLEEQYFYYKDKEEPFKVFSLLGHDEVNLVLSNGGEFIAHQLFIQVSKQHVPDIFKCYEFESQINNCLRSEIPDEDLIFKFLGLNSELYRIIETPKIIDFSFKPGEHYKLSENITILKAIDFVKNLKTVRFSDLSSSEIAKKNTYKIAKRDLKRRGGF